MDNNSCLIYMLLHQILLFCKFLKVTKKDFKTLPVDWKSEESVYVPQLMTRHCSNKGSLKTKPFCSQCYNCPTVCSINVQCKSSLQWSLCRSLSSPLGPLMLHKHQGRQRAQEPPATPVWSVAQQPRAWDVPQSALQLLYCWDENGRASAHHEPSKQQSRSSWVSVPHSLLLSTKGPEPPSPAASDPSAEPLPLFHAHNESESSSLIFSVTSHSPSPQDLNCLSLEFIQSSRILIMSIFSFYLTFLKHILTSHFQHSSFHASLQGLFFNTQYIPIIFKQVKFTLYYSKDALHF